MKNYILLLSLVVIVVLAGCIGQTPTTPIKYKNDIITVEEYSVDTLNPYAGDLFTISFSIKNNGEESIDWVEVNFFDIPSFTVKELTCGGVTVVTMEGHNKCTFQDDYKLVIFDVREISLTLKAPPKELILSPKKFTLSYSISYNYSGTREAHIPLIDGITKKTPTGRFIQSEPMYGPIQVDFTPPVGRETKQDNRVITEHFGIINKSFKIELNFRHVGSSSLGKIEKVNITKDKIKVDFQNTLQPAKLDSELVCDFEKTDGIYESEKDIIVPGKLLCNLNSTLVSSLPPEAVGIISINYSYDYKFIRTETIEVQPIPTE